MTPIQTRYAGRHFRSRLEARWAVFFDALDVSWDYEPEGFETSAGRYLPDFLIRSGRDLWIEVKPPTPLVQRDQTRIFEFAREAFRSNSDVGVIVVRGVPPGENAFMFHKSPQNGERLGAIEPMVFVGLLCRDLRRIAAATEAALSTRF